MLKKTINYTDYNEVTRTEDFYFNLSRSEIAEMELGVDGGFSAMLQKIIATKNTKELMAQWKNIILKAYGEKSSDGKRFIKSPELSEAFVQTEAYSELFFELMDADKASAFINGILPQDLVKQAQKAENANFVASLPNSSQG